jgi:NADPH:quinone reductase-like Zn-dependent oxidoreductase
MVKRLTHTGSTHRPRSIVFKSKIAPQLQEKVWPLIEKDKVRPVMDCQFDLADARRAHARTEADDNIGKIVLAV